MVEEDGVARSRESLPASWAERWETMRTRKEVSKEASEMAESCRFWCAGIPNRLGITRRGAKAWRPPRGAARRPRRRI